MIEIWAETLDDDDDDDDDGGGDGGDGGNDDIILLIKMMVMSHVIGNGVMIFVMETLRSSHIRMQASWSINVVCQESCRLLSHRDKKPEPQAC